MVEAALLRYLAVAHFGRGRGDWAEGEAPAHWKDVVAAALAPHREALARAVEHRAARPAAMPTSRPAAQPRWRCGGRSNRSFATRRVRPCSRLYPEAAAI